MLQVGGSYHAKTYRRRSHKGMPMITRPLVAVGDDANSELRDRVKQFLASQHFASFRRLEVIVLRDSIVLHGFIPTFHERQMAVALCQQVVGMRRVVDQLIVPEPWPAGDGEKHRRLK
jgi:hypothetical protein